MEKYCRTCGWHALSQRDGKDICARNNTYINLNKDFCSNHNFDIQTCALCGRPLAPPQAIYDIDLKISICEHCYPTLGTCQTCNHQCNINTDTSGKPKTIQQQVRQGNMVMIQEVPNPELVNQYCNDSCMCFQNNICNRQYNCCNNYKYINDSL